MINFLKSLFHNFTFLILFQSIFIFFNTAYAASEASKLYILSYSVFFDKPNDKYVMNYCYAECCFENRGGIGRRMLPQTRIDDGLSSSCYKTEKYKDGVLNYLTLSGYSKWLDSIHNHESLSKAVSLLSSQYKDLDKRLTLLHNNRKHLIDKYNDDSFIEAIDEDISELSLIGYKLTEITKKFFSTIKPMLIELDILSARKSAMEGLRSFTNSVDDISSSPSKSLDEIVDAIEFAVTQLEEARNK